MTLAAAQAALDALELGEVLLVEQILLDAINEGELATVPVCDCERRHPTTEPENEAPA